MLPQERLNLLLEAIRTENLFLCSQILEKNPEEIINLPSDMNESDIARLLRKSGRPRDFLVPRATTQCTPIFYAVLYNFFGVFELVWLKGGNLQAKTAGNVDLAVFSMGCKASIRIFTFFNEQAPSLIKAAMFNPDNPFTTKGPQFTSIFSVSGKFPEELEYLAIASQKGLLEAVNEALAVNTHKKDTMGSALAEALTRGHVEIVQVLKDAKLPILPKHYWAAGMAGGEKGPTLYSIIRQPSTRRNPLPGPTPDYVMSGNLKRLHEAFNSPPDAATQSQWLYYSSAMGYISTTRYLLEKGVTVEPRHFYAAGRFFNPEAVSTTAPICIRLFEMLQTASNKEPIPASFYTEQEQNAYLNVIQPNRSNNNSRQFVPQ